MRSSCLVYLFTWCDVYVFLQSNPVPVFIWLLYNERQKFISYRRILCITRGNLILKYNIVFCISWSQWDILNILIYMTIYFVYAFLLMTMMLMEACKKRNDSQPQLFIYYLIYYNKTFNARYLWRDCYVLLWIILLISAFIQLVVVSVDIYAYSSFLLHATLQCNVHNTTTKYT